MIPSTIGSGKEQPKHKFIVVLNSFYGTETFEVRGTCEMQACNAAVSAMQKQHDWKWNSATKSWEMQGVSYGNSPRQLHMTLDSFVSATRV